MRHLSVLVISIFVIFTQAFAGEKPKLLREGDPTKTPCGLYLASLVDNSTGEKVADPTPESLHAFFKSNPDLSSKLVYVDKNSGKSFKTAEDLRKAIEAGTAMAVMNTPELVWVGLPKWGAKKRELVGLTKELLEDSAPESKAVVRDLWRPNREMSSLPAYVYQQIRYLFPSVKLDYQKPLPAEKSAAYWKLLVSNGSQQVFLFFVRPWHVALSTGAVNFINSYYTGVYRRFLSNWFNRSANAPARWARNIGLSAFFTTDLYWAGRESWEKFKAIASVEGWRKFAVEKWGSTAFGVVWRYFYGQGIAKWEKEMALQGRAADARRTAGRLEFIGTFVTTPAFIWSAIAPTRFMLSIMGYDVMGLNEGHLMMMAVGAFGALHYYKIPKAYLNPAFWVKRMMGSKREGELERFTWDPWVDRLDRFHEFNKGWAGSIGLTRAVDFIERTVRLAGSVGWRKNGNGVDESTGPINGDVRKLIDMDKDLVKWLEQDPELYKMMQEDPELRRLIATDPHFVELRDELLAQQEE